VIRRLRRGTNPTSNGPTKKPISNVVVPISNTELLKKLLSMHRIGIKKRLKLLKRLKKSL